MSNPVASLNLTPSLTLRTPALLPGMALCWRPLLPVEQAFVCQFFGAGVGAWLVGQVRLGRRRLGDTRRALSCNGGWVSLPRAMFVGGDWRQPLRLAHPVAAGVLAHELLHVLQRRQGLPVTRQALVLQGRWLLQRRDPYGYPPCASARALLRQFWAANVEQQGQMWQDWVQAQVAGRPLPSHALLPLAIQHGRMRRAGPRLHRIAEAAILPG